MWGQWKYWTKYIPATLIRRLLSDPQPSPGPLRGVSRKHTCSARVWASGTNQTDRLSTCQSSPSYLILKSTCAARDTGSRNTATKMQNIERLSFKSVLAVALFAELFGATRVSGYTRCGLWHHSQKNTRFITKKSNDVFGNIQVRVSFSCKEAVSAGVLPLATRCPRSQSRKVRLNGKSRRLEFN